MIWWGVASGQWADAGEGARATQEAVAQTKKRKVLRARSRAALGHAAQDDKSDIQNVPSTRSGRRLSWQWPVRSITQKSHSSKNRLSGPPAQLRGRGGRFAGRGFAGKGENG